MMVCIQSRIFVLVYILQFSLFARPTQMALVPVVEWNRLACAALRSMSPELAGAAVQVDLARDVPAVLVYRELANALYIVKHGTDGTRLLHI